MFTCRVCLTFEDNLFPISDYLEEFFIVTGILAEKDGLLCPSCIQHLNEAVTFRDKAIKADEILQKVTNVEEILVKQEPDLEEIENDNEEKGEGGDILDETVEVIKERDCPYCFFNSTNRLELKKHINEHIVQNGGLECNKCMERFKTKKKLKAHLAKCLLAVEKSDDAIAVFMCQICGKTYRKKAGLFQHTRLHDKSQQYQCTRCEKTFSCLSYLKMHEHRHGIGRPFVCTVCGKSFKQKVNLQEHETVHTTERKFSCDVCGSLFKTARLLKSHKLIHSDTYRHTCMHCGMNFKRKSNLREHLLCHTEKREFSCNQCGTVFKAKASLKRHMKKHGVFAQGIIGNVGSELEII